MSGPARRMVYQVARDLAREDDARSFPRHRKLRRRGKKLRREQIYRLRSRQGLPRRSETTASTKITGRHLISAESTSSFEILQATSPVFLATARRARKCAPPPASPSNSRRQTFPNARPDCRCNSTPSLPGFLEQPANRIVARHDARRSNAVNAIA